MFLSLRLPQPLLLEGAAGVGKTEAAKALATVLDTPLVRLQCYDGIDAAEALYEWNYPRQLLSIRLADANRRAPLRGRPVRAGLPDPPAAAARARAPGPASGGAADRRDRPRRRRLRGVPARAARRGGGDDPGARDGARDAPAGHRPHLEPDARPARRGQAPLPLPLDRLPVARARGRDRAPPGEGRVGVARRAGRRDDRPDPRERRAEAARDRRGDRLARRARAARRRDARRGRAWTGRSGPCSSTRRTRTWSAPPAWTSSWGSASDPGAVHGADDRARPARGRGRVRPPPARGGRAGHAGARGPLRPGAHRRAARDAAAPVLDRARDARLRRDPGPRLRRGLRRGLRHGRRRHGAAGSRGRAQHPGRARPPHGRGAPRRARRLGVPAARDLPGGLARPRRGRARRRRPRSRRPGRAERRGAAAQQALRRPRARGARAPVPADEPPRGRDADAPHAARRARPPRRARRHAAHAAREPAHGAATRSGSRTGAGASSAAGS